jgi:hypothetical protein
MADLILYEAARAALAAARNVDEVKKVLNEAAAIAAYSKIAKDRTLEADAVEIRKRAERRLGEMMATQPKAKGGQPHQKKKPKSTGISKNPVEEEVPITLADAGIDKNLATRARDAAGLSESEFENEIREIRNDVQSRPECSRPKKMKFNVKYEDRKIIIPYYVSKDEDAADASAVVVKPIVKAEPVDDYEAEWRRLMTSRTDRAVDDAGQDDWRDVDAEIVEMVRRAAAAWQALADFLETDLLTADAAPGNVAVAPRGPERRR